jgi:hypothetical protein
MEIVRCPSCDGFGWQEDEFNAESADCDWCAGVGYVYRDAQGIDHIIPATDYAQFNAQLEQLEQERLHEMGYSGQAKKPWEQEIRRGTQGGENPYFSEA